MYYDEESFRRWVASAKGPSPFPPDFGSIKEIWDALETTGVSKPADLEQFMTGHGSSDHTAKIFEDVLSCFREEKPFRAGKISLGVVPTGRLEAYISKVREEFHCIVIDTYLGSFLSFSCFTALACGFERPSPAQVDLYTTGVFNQLDNFFGRGTWDPQSQLFQQIVTKNYNASVMTSYVLTCLTAFIFAHELSHLALGHTQETKHLYGIAPGQTAVSRMDVFNHSQWQELEADRLGMEILLALMKDPERWPTVKLEGLYTAVPLFFFDLLDVYYKRYAAVLGKEIVSREHPSPAHRREAILEAFPEIRTEWSNSLYEGLEEFAQHLLENC